jgi:hypothetical protein
MAPTKEHLAGCSFSPKTKEHGKKKIEISFSLIHITD